MKRPKSQYHIWQQFNFLSMIYVREGHNNVQVPPGKGVRIAWLHCCIRRLKWDNPLDETANTEAPCSICATKIPPCTNTLDAERITKLFCSLPPPMVMIPNERNILKLCATASNKQNVSNVKPVRAIAPQADGWVFESQPLQTRVVKTGSDSSNAKRSATGVSVSGPRRCPSITVGVAR